VCASSAAIGSGIRDERVNRHCLFLSAEGAGWLGEGRRSGWATPTRHLAPP